MKIQFFVDFIVSIVALQCFVPVLPALVIAGIAATLASGQE